MLALVAAGKPVQTDPMQVGPQKWMFTVPEGVSHVAIFFTQPPSVGYGAAIYHQIDTEAWTFLGVLTCNKPSAIFKINRSDLASKLGIDIEPEGVLMGLMGGQTAIVPAAPTLKQQQSTSAIRILENLYNYVMSYTSDPTNPMQAIPIKLFNDWYAMMAKKAQDF